jgi:hypothetical protein
MHRIQTLRRMSFFCPQIHKRLREIRGIFGIDLVFLEDMISIFPEGIMNASGTLNCKFVVSLLCLKGALSGIVT